ncbi:MAG: hypothetical protein NVSMB29_01010 [Candidatus Dormibacteria bacterium]
MRRLLLCLTGVALASAGAISGWRSAAADPPPAAVQYVALLGDAGAALDATPPDVARARGTLNALLDPASEVTRGSHPAAALQPILDELNRDPPDLLGAHQRLELLVAALRLPDRSVAPLDQGYAPHLLREVYRSPAFRDLDARPDQDLAARLGRAVREALAGKRLPGGRLVQALGALGLLGLTVAVVRLLRRAGLARHEPATGRTEPAGTTSDPEAEWAAAEAAAAAGDYREAVRRAFRSALLIVAVQGRLQVEPTWTTRELLVRASGDADLLAALAPAASGFDRAWYSEARVDEGEWQRARGRCEAVRSLAARAVRL